jgi:tyrosinase
MYGIDRRDFAITVATSLGLLQPASRMPLLRLSLKEQQATFIRRNVYCLSATSPELRAYKRAIDVMRARPANDPTSWQAQSNIHGAFRPNPATGVLNVCPPATAADFVAPAGMIADACQHNNLFFLAWHRIYLYYFERIVRAASGDTSFALPYWGYSPTDPRNLPEPFRSPGDATNALWTDQRATTINAGGNITASWVDASPALALTSFSTFQSTLSSTPHDLVHVAVGGGCGWMSAFETAGMDPIFWLHHANIDRLWDDWIASGGGRANPRRTRRG